ncbi:MAG: NAD(P)H-dependent oxidoreductase subunit E, partial [Thauera sp.]
MADTPSPPDRAQSRKTRPTQRGRQLDPRALGEIEALLAGRPRTRDSLIEHLHAIQDAWGHLALRHLHALAHWMNLPMAAVYETASFYAHFDIVRDEEIPPPALTIRVCDSLSCELAGARALHAALAAELDPADIRVLRAPCMGRCDSAPVVEVGHRHLGNATPAAVRTLLDSGDLHPEPIDWPRLDAYHAEGGYALLNKARSGQVTVEQLSQVLQDAGLRGLGGAGFPTFKKWSFVRAEPAPRYMVINADEGEPGTFKDRHYLEQAPHRFLEGALVSAWAVDAAALYIYLRDEYPGLHAVLSEAIAEVEAAGLAAPGYSVLRRGAGANICGAESARIESLE